MRVRSAWVLLAVALALGAISPRAVVGQALSPDSPPTPATPRALAYGSLPLSFEPNHGQAAQAIDFLARGHGYTILLGGVEATLALRRPNEPLILGMRLIGAEPAPAAAGLDLRRGVVNYLLGNDPTLWRTGVPTYGRIAYRDAYPGIDLVYYGTDGDLEYDLVVKPGADPDVIRFELIGVDSLEFDAAGDLQLWAAGEEIRLRRPLLYQDIDGGRHEVEGGYALAPVPAGGAPSIGFSIGAYDPNLPLVIDPVLVYSTYLGGGGGDYANGIAVDRDGNAYVAGETQSANFPTASPFQATRAGGQDAFIAKIEADGSDLAYATYLGGSGGDYANGIAVDRDGRAYVIGTTSSTNFRPWVPYRRRTAAGAATRSSPRSRQMAPAWPTLPISAAAPTMRATPSPLMMMAGRT